jgi:hypothetical protein
MEVFRTTLEPIRGLPEVASVTLPTIFPLPCANKFTEITKTKKLSKKNLNIEVNLIRIILIAVLK